ncbi:MAG: RNA-binding cell elongation regulator Jag/EloR [Actinomycetota bacterium]
MARKTDTLQELLNKTLELMDISADVTVSEDEDALRADIEGEDLSVLIGGRGKTLNALQCLLNVAVNHNTEEWHRVVIDAAGYREKRLAGLEKCALKTAEQALDEDREISLEPMNSYERRIVHCALAEREDIKTTSCGEEPYRFIIISPSDKNTA